METVKIKVYIYIFCGFFSHFPFVQTQPKVVNPSKQGSKDQNPESFYFTLKESERERESNGVVIIIGGGADADG